MTTFYSSGIPGHAYWRAELPAGELGANVLSARTAQDSVQYDVDTNSLSFPFQRGDVAIWSHPGSTQEALLIAGLQAKGVKVYVEVDDIYLCRPPHQTVWTVGRKKDELSQHSIWVHRKIVRFADGILASTPKLGGIYSLYNPNVRVGPNFTKPEHWEFRKRRTENLRVGFTGSASHNRDVLETDRALSWAAHADGVQVLLYGSLWIPSEHTKIPWTDDLVEYRRSLMKMDVGLAPLKPTNFNLYKSDSKILEYAMARVMPVFSPVGPHASWADWAHENDLGFCVADTPKKFLKAVKWAKAHQDEVRDVADLFRERAIQVCEERIGTWRETWE